MIYVAKISYRDAGGSAQTAYFTTGRGWRTRSTDTPASAQISGRLINPGSVRRAMFKDAASFGPVEQGFGAIELNNGDGGLDGWRNYFLAGNEYELFALTYEGEPTSSWTSVLKMRMLFAQFTLERMTIVLRDRLQELNVPLAYNFFAGTGANFEGEAFVANVRKPWGVGDCFNLDPVLIDATKIIYAVSDSAYDPATITRYEKAAGVAISRAANYTSQADCLATAPAAGQTRRYPAGGVFRLGTGYSGPVTTDISFGDTTAKIVHNCIKDCAIRAGVSSGDISSADISALDASPTINAGYYVKDAETALSVMTKLANGGGIWFGFDRTGIMRLGKVDTYSGSAVYAFTEHNSLSIVRDVSGGLTAPIYSITMRWAKRWHSAPGMNLALGGLAADGALAMPWLEYTTSDSATLTNNPYAQKITRDSYSMNLDSVAAPSGEAARQLALFKVLRASYRVTAQVTLGLLAVDLGDTVSLQHPRFGLTSATNFKVIGIEHDFEADTVSLVLWG